MGAEASTEQGTEFMKAFQNKYSFNTEVNDSRFGDIQIYKENAGEGMVFLKSHWCQSEEDYNQFLKSCNFKVNNTHQNILRLIGFTQSSDMQLCGDFSKITVYYEFYQHNMERELDRRHNRSQFFNEEEIWFLLDSIVSAGAFFEQQKQNHGDIRPSNILLTNEGLVKMADQGLINSDKNGYIKALQYGEQAYLSPQQIESLKQRQIQPKHNQYKSDVYSLGMTMLEVCCLYTARACYDYANCKILDPVIQDLLSRARQRYSQFLINIISELLQPEEANRPSFLELQTLLAPYQDSIQNLIPFTPDFSLVKRSQIVNPQQQQLGQTVVYQEPGSNFQSRPQEVLIQNQPQTIPGTVHSQILPQPTATVTTNNSIPQQQQSYGQPIIQSPEKIQYQQIQQQQQPIELSGQIQINQQQQQPVIEQQIVQQKVVVAEPQQQVISSQPVVTQPNLQQTQYVNYQEQQLPQQSVQETYQKTDSPSRYVYAQQQPQQQQQAVQYVVEQQPQVQYVQAQQTSSIHQQQQPQQQYYQQQPQQTVVVNGSIQQQPQQQQQEYGGQMNKSQIDQYQQQPQPQQQQVIYQQQQPQQDIDMRVRNAINTSEQTILRYANVPQQQQQQQHLYQQQ